MAQIPGVDREAQLAEMRKLEGMLGRWLGQGERYLPSGETYAFTQTLEITPQSGGLIVTIAGQSLPHMENLEERKTKTPGAGSFAVVTYDETQAAYQFRSFGFGRMIAAEAELVDDRIFRWTTAGPVMLRFTIDLREDGVWEEIGERSRDGGETWEPTNKLTAYRVARR
ncbi:MAG: hypothetical protein AAGL49_14375 [Pseudomonadota bacterium]